MNKIEQVLKLAYKECVCTRRVFEEKNDLGKCLG